MLTDSNESGPIIRARGRVNSTQTTQQIQGRRSESPKGNRGAANNRKGKEKTLGKKPNLSMMEGEEQGTKDSTKIPDSDGCGH